MIAAVNSPRACHPRHRRTQPAAVILWTRRADMRYFFFFFQAEDGIRDIGVTGVQTCALPISNPSALARAGWTKSRSVEALKPGTRVKLYIGTSRVGGMSGIVMKIENEKGENEIGRASCRERV